MSLKIVKSDPWLTRVALIAAAVLCLAAAWFFIKWNFANVVASHIDPERTESKLVADWLTRVAPNDPQTHLAAALLYEKTFDPGDLTRSLSEYEMTAALSPHNYHLWIDLGRARSQSGDADGAEAAFARGLELAPNYASVQWVYGNFLMRQGKTDEAFALIAKAAASNPDYSRTAAVTALQIFDGDISQVRRALGDSEVTNAALAEALASEKRFDAAAEAWTRSNAINKIGKFKTLGEKLITQFAESKKFQLAARIAADLGAGDAEKPVIGQIANSGFENGVKTKNAGLFEWQIAEGLQPQIGLGEGQTHGGKYSLLMIFNTFETAGFRGVSQTVAVTPGAEYEFEVFYRSDLKASATIKWEIADAATMVALASTQPLISAGDWTSLKVKFTVPADSDGVIIRMAREGCIGPSCLTNGRLSFDDISIRRL